MDLTLECEGSGCDRTRMTGARTRIGGVVRWILPGQQCPDIYELSKTPTPAGRHFTTGDTCLFCPVVVAHSLLDTSGSL